MDLPDENTLIPRTREASPNRHSDQRVLSTTTIGVHPLPLRGNGGLLATYETRPAEAFHDVTVIWCALRTSKSPPKHHSRPRNGQLLGRFKKDTQVSFLFTTTGAKKDTQNKKDTQVSFLFTTTGAKKDTKTTKVKELCRSYYFSSFWCLF